MTRFAQTWNLRAMPWKETSPMNERVKFIAAMLEAEELFLELCERFGISRKQGYKWKQRYETGGVEALADRSRAPHSHPHAVSSEVEELLVAARKKHRLWGPRKLLVVVGRQHPKVVLPSASTVGAILKKRGLVGKPRRVRRNDPYKDRLGPYDDGFRRYLLMCKALRSTTCAPVRRSFEVAFREFGMPDAIRTDNGPPFSTLAPGGAP